MAGMTIKGPDIRIYSVETGALIGRHTSYAKALDMWGPRLVGVRFRVEQHYKRGAPKVLFEGYLGDDEQSRFDDPEESESDEGEAVLQPESELHPPSLDELAQLATPVAREAARAILERDIELTRRQAKSP